MVCSLKKGQLAETLVIAVLAVQFVCPPLMNTSTCGRSSGIPLQYNLGNPTYMGPRYRRIMENYGLLGKVGTNLLSCTAQHTSFRN
jgi:hypothetical protein